MVIAFVLSGCASSGERACVNGADCASGVCLSDGTCAPEAADGGTGGDADQPGDGAVAACDPDHDGTVSRAEVPLAAGRRATFRVALDAPVDTAGELQGGGDRIWDFSGAIDGEDDVEAELLPVAGWWADLFPGATYAARLSQSQELLGVFELTEQALLLRGVVSPEAGIYRTELSYDPPVRVLAFPIAADDGWSDTATVDGLAQGVYTIYTEAYESDVDAVGQAITPFGEFPVLRVRVELTRTIGAGVITSRTYLFVSECYGTVAAVVSQDYEPDSEFTEAAELRRLAP
jgi:hypothetical protein